MALSKTVAENAEVGRTGILDAAALLFGRQGYGAVSLRMIAEAAGIKAGSIYYHFASKDDIITEILDAGIQAVHDEVRDRVVALNADASARDVFRAVLRGHLCALLEHGDYTSANVRIFGQVPPVVRDANLPVRRAYEAFLDNLLSELQVRDAIRSDVNLPRFRLLLIGALNATLEWFDPQKGSAEDLADDYADTFLNGILTQSGDNT
ncbi:MAG: TetR/AcrR family transcriptional regulator [Rhodobacterales bacterium]|jgi:AcrR family transcriptional regulator|tara:strand:+ start:2591 stop:3214 length:624 start_codon:yes stop_codon:yes gene_type:complete